MLQSQSALVSKLESDFGISELPHGRYFHYKGSKK